MEQSAKNERDKKYNLWARKLPTVICLIFPFTIFLVIAFSQEDVKKGGDCLVCDKGHCMGWCYIHSSHVLVKSRHTRFFCNDGG